LEKKSDKFLEENQCDIFSVFDFSRTFEKYFSEVFDEDILRNYTAKNLISGFHGSEKFC